MTGYRYGRPGQSWRLVRDDESGLGIPCPPGWTQTSDLSVAIALVESDPLERRSFRANVTVVTERTSQPDLATYSTHMLDNLARTLTDMQVLSLDTDRVCGYEGRRLLAGYRSGQYALSLEQWWTLVDGVGTTLSGTCAVEDYLYASPIFEVVAAGLLLPTGHEGR